MAPSVHPNAELNCAPRLNTMCKVFEPSERWSTDPEEDRGGIDTVLSVNTIAAATPLDPTCRNFTVVVTQEKVLDNQGVA